MSTAASHATLDFFSSEHVAHARFTRPHEQNSLTEQALDDFNDVVASVQANPAIRVLVLRGEGDVFSNGLDATLLEHAVTDIEYFEHLLTRIAAIGLALESLEVPVIAAVNGTARGSGVEIALACDVIIAAEEASIRCGEAAAGIIGGGGTTVRLPRIVGAARARELLYSGRELSGLEAVEVGLAVRAVPRAALDAAADELATAFAGASRGYLATTKRQINAGLGLDTPTAVDNERSELIRHLGTPGSEMVAGLRAEREKRSAT